MAIKERSCILYFVGREKAFNNSIAQVIVRMVERDSSVKVGLHHGSVLSPLLFATVSVVLTLRLHLQHNVEDDIAC